MTVSKNPELIVIGGGPAGMMAAGTAAERGSSVLLIEKNSRNGKKLLITGKGRCNVTNDCSRDEFFNNIPVNPKFLFSAFSRFDNHDVMDFFEQRGVALKVERGNRVFPVSDKAADINNALTDYCRHNGVRTVHDTVTAIHYEDGRVVSVETELGGVWECSQCILATGGLSYPLTGSTGDGYRFAQEAGHEIVKPKPSLVPLVIAEKDCRDAQGLSLKNIAITVREADSGKVIYKDFGEMLFTHFGMSGPVILSASSHIRNANKKHIISIDLKPALTLEQLDARIQRDFSANINKDFGNSLSKLLPQKMISVIIKRADIPYNTKVNSIRREQRLALAQLLKNLEYTVVGFRPIEEAIITSGGVSVARVNPRTMESKLVEGLYFAGEILDLDAHTGGFNLQIAFSTGRCAGMAAAERLGYDT